MLAARVAAASAAGAKKRSFQPDKAPLLPVDTLRAFLCDHELLPHMRVQVADVHCALMDLRAFATASDCGVAAKGGTATSGVPGPVDCVYCGLGKSVVDAREGCLVCNRCGAVLTLRSINVEQEYISPPPPPSHSRGVTEVRGVSKELRESLAAQPMEERLRPSRHYRDFEHWNQFAYHSDDVLRGIDRMFTDWSSNWACSSKRTDVRLAAALLYPLVTFPDSDTVRHRVHKCIALDPVHDTPVPRFPCASCGYTCHSAKEARFHCKAKGIYR